MDELQDDISSYPIQRGVVKDWDCLEKLWRVVLDEIELTSPESASVH
jgi:actin-related protein